MPRFYWQPNPAGFQQVRPLLARQNPQMAMNPVAAQYYTAGLQNAQNALQMKMQYLNNLQQQLEAQNAALSQQLSNVQTSPYSSSQPTSPTGGAYTTAPPAPPTVPVVDTGTPTPDASSSAQGPEPWRGLIRHVILHLHNGGFTRHGTPLVSAVQQQVNKRYPSKNFNVTQEAVDGAQWSLEHHWEDWRHRGHGDRDFDHHHEHGQHWEHDDWDDDEHHHQYHGRSKASEGLVANVVRCLPFDAFDEWGKAKFDAVLNAMHRRYHDRYWMENETFERVSRWFRPRYDWREEKPHGDAQEAPIWLVKDALRDIRPRWEDLNGRELVKAVARWVRRNRRDEHVYVNEKIVHEAIEALKHEGEHGHHDHPHEPNEPEAHGEHPPEHEGAYAVEAVHHAAEAEGKKEPGGEKRESRERKPSRGKE
jgi:hypothetical protein